MAMHIPFLSALTDYLQGDGAVILPEVELTLFGLGILLIDFTLGVKERYLNAGLALAGTAFSAYTVWKLRVPVGSNGCLLAFHDSVIVDPFFLFFAGLFLAATALVILLSVKEKKEGIDDDGVVKPEQRAIRPYRDAQLPDRVGAKSRSRQRQPRVQIPFFDTEREINQQDAEAKKRELDLGENDGSVSLQVIGQRAEKGNVHKHLAGLFRFRRRGRNYRRWQFCAFR